MGGNSVETDEITVIAGPTSTASTISWSNGNAPFTGLTVPSGGTTTIDVGAGAEVQMNMSVSLGANSLVYAIDGRLTTTHNYVFSAGADITRNGTGTLLITSGRGKRKQRPMVGGFGHDLLQLQQRPACHHQLDGRRIR